VDPRCPLLPVFLVLAAAGCGARTGLFVAGGDAGGALPPIHVQPPVSSGCADAGSTVIYVVSEQDSLLSFDPPTATFTRIGTLDCPVASGSFAPFSMAVDRAGIAYVLDANAEIVRVSTASAACETTSFAGGGTFGMGYSTNQADGGEVLFVASDEATPRLATLDTTTFALSVIGPLDPPIVRPELTGTGGGDLFAFYGTKTGSAIAQIDTSTAQSIGQATLPGVYQNRSYAFAVWGGDFYTFTGDPAGTVVTRFRPTDGSIVRVAQIGDVIVGAGVSTCAPE
jgi:hypothetical protein